MIAAMIGGMFNGMVDSLFDGNSSGLKAHTLCGCKGLAGMVKPAGTGHEGPRVHDGQGSSKSSGSNAVERKRVLLKRGRGAVTLSLMFLVILVERSTAATGKLMCPGSSKKSSYVIEPASISSAALIPSAHVCIWEARSRIVTDIPEERIPEEATHRGA